MNVADFKQSLNAPLPPEKINVYAQALWYDAKGDWDRSHQLVQDLPDQNAAWIHAYLHRKEGDQWNDDYLYNQAGRKRPAVSLEEEWEQIAAALL